MGCSNTAKTVRIYLSARYGRKFEMVEKALELEALSNNIKVKSSWIYGISGMDNKQTPMEMYRVVANDDIRDLCNSNLVVFFQEPLDKPHAGASRGGRHFETGYAYAAGIPTIIVGIQENIFHYLDNMKIMPCWDMVKEYIRQIALNGNNLKHKLDRIKDGKFNGRFS